MTTVEFITELFCGIDDEMKETPKHPQSLQYASVIVTLGVVFAQKGGGRRAFYRWLERDYRPLFPKLTERRGLFRLFAAHWDWTFSKRFFIEPGINFKPGWLSGWRCSICLFLGMDALQMPRRFPPFHR